MKILYKIIDYYVFSNLHVSIAAFSFTKLTLVFYGNYTNEIPLFVLLATFLAYNFLRVYDLNNCADQWLYNWTWSNLTMIKCCSIIAFFLLIYVSFFVEFSVLFWFLPMIILTFLYIIPLFKIKKKFKSFRRFPYLKMLYVVVVWTFSTTLIPIISIAEFEFNGFFLVFLSSRFLLFLVLIIPFEIRDLGYDASYLKTLPQVVGVFNTKLIGVLLLMVVAFLNFLVYVDIRDLFISSIIILTIFFLLINSNRNQSNYYCAFWVEGIPILWLILVEL